jgi:Vacuolar sorting-associated protein 13, N-terminal
VEEVFGEYILNMSKDNLKIAALRGKIKLENVQLDGELIGSHVLGAVPGLNLHQPQSMSSAASATVGSPFGGAGGGGGGMMQGGQSQQVGAPALAILSCSAKSIKVIVPWKTLEKEPTRIEVRGVHLVCVPLLPSTANKMYGAGTLLDPQCSLRTRAKRHVLARLERNFWNGQLQNQGGPPMKQVQRAVREVERDIKLRRRAAATAAAAASSSSSTIKSKSSSSWSATEESTSSAADLAEAEEAIDNLIFECGGGDIAAGGDHAGGGTHHEEKSSKDSSTSYFSTDDLPQIPRDWKVKVREKVMRNMEATLHDVHIRCEVSEKEGVVDNNILGGGGDGGGGSGSSSSVQETNSSTTSNNSSSHKGVTGERRPAEERAFAFGFTLESLVVRTASENWEVGSHDRRNPVNGSTMSSVKGHLGPNEYMVKNNKIGYFNKLSMYWDDQPPILLADTDVLRGNYRKLSPEKLQSRIAAAMDAMFHRQEPGKVVRQSLSVPVPRCVCLCL